MAHDGGAGKGNRTCPVGDHESAAGMSVRFSLPGVMAAKHLADLPQRLRPFELGLPFPVQRESLPTDTATGIGLLLRGSAKYLHVPRPPQFHPKWNSPVHGQ